MLPPPFLQLIGNSPLGFWQNCLMQIGIIKQIVNSTPELLLYHYHTELCASLLPLSVTFLGELVHELLAWNFIGLPCFGGAPAIILRGGAVSTRMRSYFIWRRKGLTTTMITRSSSSCPSYSVSSLFFYPTLSSTDNYLGPLMTCGRSGSYFSVFKYERMWKIKTTMSLSLSLLSFLLHSLAACCCSSLISWWVRRSQHSKLCECTTNYLLAMLSELDLIYNYMKRRRNGHILTLARPCKYMYLELARKKGNYESCRSIL